MTLLEIKRALVPLVNLFDRSNKVPNKKPAPHEENTRFPHVPWDLRTIIIVFPSQAPFQYVNLNTTLGLTGVPFDQTENWQGQIPGDAFDLQFALEGENGSAAYKKYHSIFKELSYKQDPVYFKLGERLLYQGRWPEYNIIYRQPEADVDMSIRLKSLPHIHWWAYFPGLYWHYTSFCNCRLEWKWHGKSGRTEAPALHDHGWGRNLLPVRVPLRVFRYEVLCLPDEGIGLSLWTEGPLGMKLKTVGLLRWPDRPMMVMKRYDCRILESDSYPNYSGQACRVPRRWVGRQEGDCGNFRYEAERTSEPRAVLGQGFLYGFRFSGKLAGQGLPAGTAEGQGYVEHMGRFL